jgi:phosphate butyryltransferase
LCAVQHAASLGIAKAVLVGDENLIRPLMNKVGMKEDTCVIHEPDMTKASLKAVSLVSTGKAQVVMKGLVNSSDFLRAVLNGEVGLRTGRLLNHLAVFELPDADKLIFLTDGGMNIAPTLIEKKDILINSILALQGLGIEKPNVAVLTANEQVNAKMPATVDARDLVEISKQPDFPSSIVEGPIAFDVAVSPEAAKHKKIKSEISGKADLFLVPNIETGNVLGKVWIHYAKAKMAGLVLGTTHPVVMTSRSETAEGKLDSIALASLIYHGNNKI